MTVLPSNEVLHDRRLYYGGFLLATISFVGIYILISMAIFVILSRNRHRKSLGLRLALPFSIAMMVCSIITWSLDAWQVERSLVENDHHGPNPAACGEASEIVSAVLHTMPVLLSDALLFYRAWVILSRKWSWMVVPAALYVTSSGLAIAVISKCSSRTAIGFVRTIELDHLPIIFFSFSVALNIYLTGAIIIKLWNARRILKDIGPFMAAQAQPYTSIIEMFVESALPYSASGIFYIATIVSASSVQYISGRLFFVSSCLSPAVIVIRIALGVSYSPSEQSNIGPETHHNWTYQVEQEICVDPAHSSALVNKHRPRHAERGLPLKFLPSTAQSGDCVLSIHNDIEALGSVHDNAAGMYDKKVIKMEESGSIE